MRKKWKGENNPTKKIFRKLKRIKTQPLKRVKKIKEKNQKITKKKKKKRQKNYHTERKLASKKRAQTEVKITTWRKR